MCPKGRGGSNPPSRTDHGVSPSLVSIRKSTRRPTAGRLKAIARALLDAAPLCAIATVSPGGRAHVNTAYFAWSPRFEIVWLSAPEARHSRNLAHNGTTAIAVFDSRQTWGRRDRGIQLFGTAGEARGVAARAAEQLYARRFRRYELGSLSGYRFYRFRPRSLKLFDEARLGGGLFVTVQVSPQGELSWLRTEEYTSD